jgi:hypothetical protein
MSAIGSVIVICEALLPLLPAGLDDAGYLTGQSELAEADPAEPKLAQKGARAAAQPAAIVLLDRVFRGPLRLYDQRFLGQVILPGLSAVGCRLSTPSIIDFFGK